MLMIIKKIYSILEIRKNVMVSANKKAISIFKVFSIFYSVEIKKKNN